MKTFTVKSVSTSLLLYAVILFGNQAAFAQLTCQISGSQISQTGSLVAGDATQIGRVVRGGVVGSCPTGNTNTLQNSTAVVQDNYTYTAPVTGCATVNFNATACGGATTQMVAYSTYNPASPAANVIGDFGFSTVGTASFSFPVTAGQNYTLVVHDILETPTNLFCANYSFTVTYRTGCRQPGFDRANDGKADLAAFGPGGAPDAQQSWFNREVNTAGSETRQFGITGDIPTAGDYTGDGQTDLSVYRPATNTWYYATNQSTPSTSFVGVPWGVANDKVVPGDYDADGRNDIAIWRPSNGSYYVLRSATNTLQTQQWGRSGDTPVPADIDGDFITDFVVVRPDQAGESQLVWFVLQSNLNFGFGYFARWGSPGDIPVPADYDGNGKSDIAIFRRSSGLWAIIPSLNQQGVVAGQQTGIQWGTSVDVPQPADYDGDLKADQAVFRFMGNIWFIRNSATNTPTITGFGSPTGITTPVTAPYPLTVVQ